MAKEKKPIARKDAPTATASIPTTKREKRDKAWDGGDIAELRKRAGQSLEQFAQRYARGNVDLVVLWEKGSLKRQWNEEKGERGPVDHELSAMRQTASYYEAADALKAGPLRDQYEWIAGSDRPELSSEFERAFDEAAFNGTPIYWEGLLEYKNLTPLHAAQISHCIDPFKQVDQLTDTQREARDDRREDIARLEHLLRGEADQWDLRRLMIFLAVRAPVGMTRAVEIFERATNPPSPNEAQLTQVDTGGRLGANDAEGKKHQAAPVYAPAERRNDLPVGMSEAVAAVGGKPERGSRHANGVAASSSQSEKNETSEIIGSPNGQRLSTSQWMPLARKQGQAIRDRDNANDLFPSIAGIAHEIERDWRERRIIGPKGFPLSGSTIQREALSGLTLHAPGANRRRRGERGERGER